MLENIIIGIIAGLISGFYTGFVMVRFSMFLDLRKELIRLVRELSTGTVYDEGAFKIVNWEARLNLHPIGADFYNLKHKEAGNMVFKLFSEITDMHSKLLSYNKNVLFRHTTKTKEQNQTTIKLVHKKHKEWQEETRKIRPNYWALSGFHFLEPLILKSKAILEAYIFYFRNRKK